MVDLTLIILNKYENTQFLNIMLLLIISISSMIDAESIIFWLVLNC